MKSTMKIFLICCLLIVSVNSALAQSGTFSLSAAQLEYVYPPAYSEGYYDHYATIQVPRDVPLKITYSNNTNNGLYLVESGNLITGQTTITNGSFTYISKTGYIDIISEWLWSYFPFADEGFNMYSISWALDENYSVSSNSWTSNNATILGKLGIGSYYTSSSAKLSITNTSENYSLYSNTTKNISSSIYGVYSSTNNSTGNVYGLYSTVTGVTGKKWSGYFNGGDVAILGGNTGIGTNAPKEKLTIAGGHGDTKLRLFSTGNGSDQPANLSLWASEPGLTYYGTGIGYNVNGSPYYGRIDNTKGSSYIRFLPGETKFMFQTVTATNIDALTIKDNGRVGIGTTAIPSDFKLAVAGKIIAEEISVKLQSAWPDYVFEQNYSLKPLDQVEQFVKTNKHLPGIPSASQIEENGISIGEMQNKLLQKIEELTLYVIEQQKEIERQKIKIELLETQSK